MDLGESNKYEVSEKVKLLKIIHQIYIETSPLNQNIEHLLDMMEEIARLERILNEL